MLIFLHGWGMNKAIFSEFVSECLSDEDVLLLDLPGYNGEECDFDLDSQVVQLKEKIPKGAHLLAWSLGGVYALALEAMFPNYLSKLTMICSTPSFAQREGFDCALTPEVLDQFSEQLVINRDKTIDRFLLLQLHGQPKAKTIAKEIKEKILVGCAVENRVLEFGLSCLKEKDYRKTLRDTTLPIQFILGKKDKLVPFILKKTIKCINSSIRVVVLDKVGHLPFVTHKKILFDAVFGKNIK